MEIFHTREALTSAIQQILSNQTDSTKVDRIVMLIESIQRDMYSKGKISVQKSIIDALNLRHLLGL